MWLRIVLVRFCIATYRLKLAERRCEDADFEAAACRAEADEFLECELEWLEDWEMEEAEEPRTEFVGDDFRFLGVSWSQWGVLAVLSWLGVFGAAWYGEHTWPRPEYGMSLWVSCVAVGIMALVNGLPGVAALFSRKMRGYLLSVPEAVALTVLTVPGIVGLSGAAVFGLFLGMEARLVGEGIIFGIMIFPLTLGVMFPLGVPLACGLVVWWRAGRSGRISDRAYMWLMSMATGGWSVTGMVGVVIVRGLASRAIMAPI